MEKFEVSKQQICRLPPGFRFHPSDEELLVYYLHPKMFDCRQPAFIIFDCDLSKHDPWNLPGDRKRERYFFNLREAKYKNGGRHNRAAASGYWKATGRDKEIISSKCDNKVVLGMKKVLVFYHGKPPSGTRTDWIMHEYRLASAAGSYGCPLMRNASSSPPHSCEERVRDDWVLCRIFKKRRANRREDDEHDSNVSDDEMRARSSGFKFIDFMGRDQRSDSPSSSSSDSSCVTDNSEGSSMDSSMCQRGP